MAYLHH